MSESGASDKNMLKTGFLQSVSCEQYYTQQFYFLRNLFLNQEQYGKGVES
jgi:hypothetical protein